MAFLSPESDGLVRRVVILGGLGGIGKTQLAIAYIKRHGSSYESVFWLNASSDATLKGSLRSLAVRAGIVDLRNEQLDDDQVCVRVLNWFSMPDNHRWLLVFDNHDDPRAVQYKPVLSLRVTRIDHRYFSLIGAPERQPHPCRQIARLGGCFTYIGDEVRKG